MFLFRGCPLFEKAKGQIARIGTPHHEPNLINPNAPHLEVIHRLSTAMKIIREFT